MKRTELARRLRLISNSLCMTAVILSLLTFPAFAISGSLTLDNGNITLTYSSDADSDYSGWTLADDGTVDGWVKSKRKGLSGKTDYTSTLTIKNSSGKDAYLSFEYTFTRNGSNSTVTLGGSAMSADSGTPTTGTVGAGNTVKLAANATYSVSIKSGDKTNSTTISLRKIKLTEIATNATVIFRPSDGGSYTVDGVQVTEETTKILAAGTVCELLATPNEANGYLFYGWVDDTGVLLSGVGEASYSLSRDADCVVYPLFYKTGTIFSADGQYFDDLNVASIIAKNATDKTVTLCKDAEISGNYTILSGVTLLIPDSTNTVYTITPRVNCDAGTPQGAYRTLTLKDATIRVDGAISLGGCYKGAYAYGDSYTAEKWGCIKMDASSVVTVSNGANLYAWGYISGTGLVTVERGGTVWEMFQIQDYHGGTITSSSGFRTNRHFPISQYYVQNIEVRLQLNAGASEEVYAAVYASGTIGSSFTFIGETGLFKVVSGSLTKRYDGSTDRVEYTIDGQAELNSISLTLGDTSLDSSEYNLPMTSNMTVNVVANENETSSLTVNEDVAMLPGVTLNIGRNAEVKLISGKSIYVYDNDDWGNYVNESRQYVAVYYAPSRTGTRSNPESAKINVNGTLTVAGNLYTTSGGSNIVSDEGTGKVVLAAAAPSSAKTYQVSKVEERKVFGFTAGYDTTFDTINVTSAQLRNENTATDAGAYIATSGANAGDVFYYCKTKCGGVWHKVGTVNVAEVGGTQYTTLTEAVGAASGNTITMLHDTTEGTIDMSNLVLDLAGCAVNANLIGTFSGFDSTSTTNAAGETGYFVPTGKITGKADSVNKTYQTATSGAFQRYVAITENGETSFHRFNISVTSFRTLFNPSDGGRGALYFEALFRGDSAVMGEVKEIGFTLTCAGSKATDTPTTTKPIQKSELFISDAVWDKPLTATSVAEVCTATAYIKFDDSAKGTVTSLPQSITYLQALKTAYANPMMLSMTNTESTLRPTEVIDDFMATYGEALGWDSATALTAYEYVA